MTPSPPNITANTPKWVSTTTTQQVGGHTRSARRTRLRVYERYVNAYVFTVTTLSTIAVVINCRSGLPPSPNPTRHKNVALMGGGGESVVYASVYRKTNPPLLAIQSRHISHIKPRTVVVSTTWDRRNRTDTCPNRLIS